MQKLNSSSRLQFTNMSMKMMMTMMQMMNMTLRQRIGRLGSAHFIINILKLQPSRNTGSVKLFAYPTKPDSPVITEKIFHPIVSSVKLPRHHSSSTPKTSEVTSWQTKGEVKRRQNSKCLRCSGRSMRGQRAKVGILRKGGQATTRVTQMMMLTAMRKVVKDLSLQQGASRFFIISKKVQVGWCSQPTNSCGEVVRTVHAFMLAMRFFNYYKQTKNSLAKLPLLHVTQCHFMSPAKRSAFVGYNTIILQSSELIIIGMLCCSDQSKVEVKSPRNQFKQKQESQPLKFKLLSVLGLKQYLIDKYVFSRYPPCYEFYKENSELKIKIEHDYTHSPYYQQEVTLIQDENHSIHAVSLNLKNRQLCQGTVIYSHGNSSDLSHSLSFISKFSAHFPKFDYVVYDYTGYGRSLNKNITQQSICQDLQLLIGSLAVDRSEIILWGFSLGCYPTVRTAAKCEFKGVLLQSPLSSIYSLFTQDLAPYSTFKNDCFSILEHIGKIESFLFIIHSKADDIVPVEHSRILFERHRMVSSNPFCFLVEVTALKHNHMHQLLGDKDSNSIRDVFHNYLTLMVERNNLPKGTQLQIQKGKYLNDLAKHELVQIVDMEGKSIKEDNPPEIIEVRESVNFSKIKQNVAFQYDDIAPEETVALNHYLQVSATKHKGYFTQSRQAREETEVSEILGERSIQRLYE